MTEKRHSVGKKGLFDPLMIPLATSLIDKPLGHCPTTAAWDFGTKNCLHEKKLAFPSLAQRFALELRERLRRKEKRGLRLHCPL
jgi:hypothetical protein